MIDGNEADDKIIAVLEGDAVYGDWREIERRARGAGRPPAALLPHLQAGSQPRPSARVEITDVYGRDEAYEVIRRTQHGLRQNFGNPETRLKELRDLLMGRE